MSIAFFCCFCCLLCYYYSIKKIIINAIQLVVPIILLLKYGYAFDVELKLVIAISMISIVSDNAGSIVFIDTISSNVGIYETFNVGVNVDISDPVINVISLGTSDQILLGISLAKSFISCLDYGTGMSEIS